MYKILLVDDEPLILAGLRGMLDWNALGWEVAGTARNGSEALEMIREQQPELVLTDIRMPVLDGLELVRRCQDLDPALPLFIFLTSYEDFEYVRQGIKLGVLDYLVKLELTPQNLESALRRVEERVRQTRARRGVPARADGLEQYRERLLLQLYSGMFRDRAHFDRLCAEYGLQFDAPCYAVAVGALQAGQGMDTAQLATLSTAATGMAADTLSKYLPCMVTAMDLRHFTVLFPLPGPEGLEEKLGGVLRQTGDILHSYFGCDVRWAVGEPVGDILQVQGGQRSAFSALSLASGEAPVVFSRPQADYHAQRVAQVQKYISDNLCKRLSLNEVASVFNFSPGYLSQLFSQWGESGFVEFVTATRVNAAKDLMAATDLKIYEISERVGFESAFYFSKVFKKIEGVAPRQYMQRLRGARGTQKRGST